ncbi:F0F1 ATP synthase subunit B [Actinomadura parmotrematis]|uniref:ATP synthase subunit b n=1 Tax=Actinomadura parmotrematis TaxID=2864039 RepID=A0ABS7FU30_9ACTN|nr:F0F1 ATP synthase subunit B [Actinomadura parmotrematis]MBW8483903.1 F0F1 ATP synthase subunit B [Actinomadura parmotrematis]
MINLLATTLAAEEDSNPLLPDNAELVVGSIAFFIVLFLVGKLFVPKIKQTLEERSNEIEGGLERAAEAQKEAKATLEQYQAKLAEARHEASRMREEAREQGSQIIAEMKEQAQAEARRIIDAAHAQIEADRQQAVSSLRGEIGALSVDLASRVVGESLDDSARQSRVVDRFLEELEGRARSQEQITS